MESEVILKTFQTKLNTKRYDKNTIKSYMDYASLFLKHLNKYTSLNDVHVRAIESFINEKVQIEQINVSIRKVWLALLRSYTN